MKKKLILLLILPIITLFSSLNCLNKVKASEQEIIRPFALYEFEDMSNLGKDTSGNGFNLSSSGINVSAVEENDRYLKLSGNGGLYATGLSGINDFSDYMSGSYTVRTIFRSSLKNGGNYIITTGQYNRTFTVVNTSQIEIEVGNSEINPNTYSEDKIKFSQDATSWIDLVVVGNANTDVAYVYVNGVLKGELNVKTGIKFSQDPASGLAGSSYSFCIGMQGNTIGGATAQRATADYKKVEVYNCALSAENVNQLYNNDEAYVTSNTTYIDTLNALDENIYDFNITEQNTMENITKNLPSKLTANLSDGSTKEVNVIWFADTDTYSLKGLIMDETIINAKQIKYEIQCERKVTFSYDENLISISDIKIDGSPHLIDDPITKSNYELTFIISTVSEYVIVEHIKYYDVKWVADDTGLVTINVSTGGAHIEIATTKKMYKVTYYDDEFVLGVSRYSYLGNETLYEYSKEGYNFVGWYTDESLKDEFKLSNLPYETPKELKLYAKFVPTSSNYSVNIENDNSLGSVNGIDNTKTYNYGDKLNVKIDAADGYVINKVEWNGFVITPNSSSLELELVIECDSVLSVSYTKTNGCKGSLISSISSLMLLGSAIIIARTLKTKRSYDENEEN